MLRDRAAELADLGALAMLAEWDQQVMMPRDGAPARAEQLGTLARLIHGRATDEQIGEWLVEFEADGGLDELDRDIARVARRDWERLRVSCRRSWPLSVRVRGRTATTAGGGRGPTTTSTRSPRR